MNILIFTLGFIVGVLTLGIYAKVQSDRKTKNKQNTMKGDKEK